MYTWRSVRYDKRKHNSRTVVPKRFTIKCSNGMSRDNIFLLKRFIRLDKVLKVSFDDSIFCGKVRLSQIIKFSLSLSSLLALQKILSLILLYKINIIQFFVSSLVFFLNNISSFLECLKCLKCHLKCLIIIEKRRRVRRNKFFKCFV